MYTPPQRNARYPAAQSAAYSVASSHNPFSDSHTPSYSTRQLYNTAHHNHSSTSLLHQQQRSYAAAAAAAPRYDYSQTAPDENRAGLGTPLMRERLAASGAFGTAAASSIAAYDSTRRPGDTYPQQQNLSSMQQLTDDAYSNERSRSAGSVKQPSPTSNWTDSGREPDSEKSNSWKKWLLIVGIVLLIAGAVGGGIAGWKISQNKSPSSSASSSAGVGVSGDPTKFTKDSRLHKSMWGIAYAPKGTMIDVGVGTHRSYVEIV